MDIAILGYGTVGKGVGDIIDRKTPGISVKRILELPDRLVEPRMTANYDEIIGDPLYDPNRHTRVQPIHWLANGMPDFGVPVEENRTMEDWEGVPCHA